MQDSINQVRQMLEEKKFKVELLEDEFAGKDLIMLKASKGKIIPNKLTFIFLEMENMSPEKLAEHVQEINKDTFLIYICYIDGVYDDLFVEDTKDLKYISIGQNKRFGDMIVNEYIYVDKKQKEVLYEKDFHISGSKYVEKAVDILKAYYESCWCDAGI